ncbi:MAG: flagellar hook protein FlgE [Spirochaetaceae bacterium]|jgi:flagellar hook protein FlgE|nr:flagellar hook protein FlgE [Spirochaetaceae bacterium]
MMRSLYSGVSGLQNHQIRMDVVGNNVANVNTIGFKKGRVNFQDMISQSMGGAARPNDEIGGVNPKQVGLGMTVATIDTIHTQGSLQTTGVTSDLAIQGNGLFILSKGDQDFFSRAGAFGVDADGLLVNSANGLRVQGWTAQTVNGETILNNASDVGDLVIPLGSKDPAKATLDVDLACNLDKRTPEVLPGAAEADMLNGTWTLDKDIYDSFGEVHKMRVEFTKVNGVNNQWQVSVMVDPDLALEGADRDITNTNLAVGEGETAGNTFTMTFDNLGALQSAVDAAGNTIDAGKLQIPVSFDVAGGNPDEAGAPLTQTFNLNLGEVGSYTDTVTQFADTSSTKAFFQNGYGMGYLENYKIDQNGIITGVYSNGTNRALGQVALASFINPGGLEKAGETMFMESINSGQANIGPSGIAGKGKFISGALEMSNVDLAEQFTDMIVTQRGFQANSKTITTSDTMLQELLNL